MSLPSSAGMSFLTLTGKVSDLPTVLTASIILSETVLFLSFLNLHYLHDILVVNRCSGSSPLRVSVEAIQWIECRERMTFCSNLYYPMQKLNMKVHHRCFTMAKLNVSVMIDVHLLVLVHCFPKLFEASLAHRMLHKNWFWGQISLENVALASHLWRCPGPIRVIDWINML